VLASGVGVNEAGDVAFARTASALPGSGPFSIHRVSLRFRFSLSSKQGSN